MPYKNIVITPPKNLSLDTKKESQFYRGFSTVYSSGNSKLYDEELVKQDLLNHFNTRKGEMREEIEADIREILASEPRIVPIAVEVTEQDYGILLEITVTYNKTNQTENMRISFDRDAGLITQ